MPIFRDPDGQKPSHPSAGGHDAEGGGTGIRQPDDHMEVLETSQDDLMEDITPSNQDMGSQSPPKLQTSSREELIESIKRGESPTWIPSPAVSYDIPFLFYICSTSPLLLLLFCDFTIVTYPREL
jgi:hypothetical protein